MKDTTVKSAISWQQAVSDMETNNLDVIYIGAFSMDTYEEITSSGPDRIVMSHGDIAAIVRHTTTAQSVFARIKIAGLYFACMSFGCHHMTGMSNFNLDDKTRDEVDEVLSDIANIRYTRQASFEAKHVLTISACLHDDVILIGISLANETTSILQVLQETLKYKTEGASIVPLDKHKQKSVSKPLSLVKKASEASSTIGLQEQVTVNQQSDEIQTTVRALEIGISEADETDNNAPDSVEMTSLDVDDNKADEVQRRRSTKAEIERRKDSTKRETEFCEDWRTATIRSIEALRNIGPFSEGSSPTDDDKKPLILSESGYHTEPDRPKSHGTQRRVSRPTMV